MYITVSAVAAACLGAGEELAFSGIGPRHAAPATAPSGQCQRRTVTPACSVNNQGAEVSSPGCPVEHQVFGGMQPDHRAGGAFGDP